MSKHSFVVKKVKCKYEMIKNLINKNTLIYLY